MNLESMENIFECVTQSKTEAILYVAEEWGGLLVDRVRVSPFGYA